MQDKNDLPSDICLHLRQLKLATEHFHACSKILSEDTSNELMNNRLRNQIDTYFKELWQEAQQDEDNFSRILIGPEGRTFHYVSEAKVQEIFNSKTIRECSICHEENELTLTYRDSTDPLVICPICITSGQTERHKKLLFHPLVNFAYNTSIPFYQVYLLAARTPPIGSFCSHHDTYRWARHCGDFALYLGDVNPQDIAYETLEELVNNEGYDEDGSENIIEWYDTPYGNTCIHKFECLSCSKILHTLDYSL